MRVCSVSLLLRHFLFGLRDYGTATWEGGEAECDHRPATMRAGRNEDRPMLAGSVATNAAQLRRAARVPCGHCGAVRVDEQIGLEATLPEYLDKLVAVFREVRRVLKPDGLCMIEMGDSYAGAGYSNHANTGRARREDGGKQRHTSNRGVCANLTDLLHPGDERGITLLGGRWIFRATTARKHVLLNDQSTPDRVLTSLLGAKRICIKQGQDDFGQFINLLGAEVELRITDEAGTSRNQGSDIEILLNESENVRIVITQGHLDTEPPLAIAGLRIAPIQDSQAAFSIEKTGEPVAERIRDVEAIGNAVAGDASAEGLLSVDSVDDTVTLKNGFMPDAKHRGNFVVAEASAEQFTLASGDGRIHLTICGVGHCYAPNQHGSLLRYVELYNIANRNAHLGRSKQLMGVPWRLALALQEDGYILRQEVIWHKPSAMPESVTDRVTRAHSTVFMFARSERYYYDADAIREPHADDWYARASSWRDGTGTRMNTEHTPGGNRYGERPFSAPPNPLGANKRSVWTINPEPFPEAHFATWPPSLVKPMILCSTRPGDTVLDPFSGSGTTGVVARSLDRRYVGIELSEKYCAMSVRRLERQTPALPLDWSAAT
jgi:DNA methylase